MLNSPVDRARQKFTGYEADAETGLNFAEARYHLSAQGRFSSPDSVGGSIGDPQSLNRYAYVGNNPANYSDPSGHDRFSASSNGFSEGMGEEGDGYMSPENPDFDPNSILTDNMRHSMASRDQILYGAFAAHAAYDRGDYDPLLQNLRGEAEYAAVISQARERYELFKAQVLLGKCVCAPDRVGTRNSDL